MLWVFFLFLGGSLGVLRGDMVGMFFFREEVML